MHQTKSTASNSCDQTDELSAESRANFDSLPDDAFIRLKDLIDFQVIPFSATTIWRKVRARTFPVPEKVSSNIVAWRCRNIREWLSSPSSYYHSCEQVKTTGQNNTKGSENDL